MISGRKTSVADRIAFYGLALRAFWAMVILVIAIAYKSAITTRLIPNLTHVGILGFQFDLDSARKNATKLDSALGPERRALIDTLPARFDAGEVRQLQQRAARLRDVLVGRRIVWLDDNHPVNNIYERVLLNSFGIFVDPVATGTDAELLLQSSCYDLAISDVNERIDPSAGVHFAERLRALKRRMLLVLYTGQNRPDTIPVNVFGVASRADPAGFVNTIFDALERVPGPACEY